MSFIPQAHEIYKHFKGNLYQIVAIAEHSESGEQMVVYQALYGDFKIYVRPLEMFIGKVDKVKYPEVMQEFRFELQGDNASRQAERKATTQVADTVMQQATTKTTVATVHREDKELQPKQTEPCAEEYTEEELALDPLVLEFLDADSYEQRLNILAALQHRVTDEMITTMAVVCDVEVGEGSTEERFDSLKNCLLTLERYECNRIR